MDQLSGPGGENLERRAILATVLALIVLLGDTLSISTAPGQSLAPDRISLLPPQHRPNRWGQIDKQEGRAER